MRPWLVLTPPSKDDFHLNVLADKEAYSMLSSHSVSQTCCSSFDFWYLPILKSFSQPMYFPGQQVFHRIKRSQGEILHPVTVIGISWTGVGWEYGVKFPEDHPQFKPRDIESDWVNEWQLESL